MTDKLVRARSDPDPYLPTLHADTVVSDKDKGPSEEFGFTFADEWKGHKRSLDDKAGDDYHDATHKRHNFPPSNDAPAGDQGGLTFADAPARKRDLSDAGGPGSSLSPIDRLSLEMLPKNSPSDGPSKGLVFEDTLHRKRQGAVTEVVDDIGQPFDSVTESTSDPEFRRPREGWLWASAPHKRDEGSDPCFDQPVDPLIFKDPPIDCIRGNWARMKKAVRTILP